MDAIRIARADTGRDHIVKIFGSCHGHHDYVMVDVSELSELVSDPKVIGLKDNYRSMPYGAGIPQAVVEMTAAVPFNDAESMERRIDRMTAEGNPPACVIMEAAIMNCGVVLPEPGYLEAVRDITASRGVVLIFDEVKTGLCSAAGDATERFGVKPDMVTVAKGLGGGLPAGAIGGSEEVFSVVEDESVWQVGIYNGSPLVMAAARASLQEVLVPDAYEHVEKVNQRILDGCQAIIDEHWFPGYTVGIGSKGQIILGEGRIVDYETFLRNQDAELTELAWIWRMNRGILVPRGRDQEYTLSVTHTFEDADRYIEVFGELAEELTA
jgi:glutamate-1-semialdehyde 2,1-aminomutase